MVKKFIKKIKEIKTYLGEDGAYNFIGYAKGSRGFPTGEFSDDFREFKKGEGGIKFRGSLRGFLSKVDGVNFL
jgi:hypothetical protein